MAYRPCLTSGLLLVGLLTATVALAQPAATPAATPAEDEAYLRIFRGLKPKMVIEVAEADVNTYLREHPEEVALPGEFADPQVAFLDGLVQISARTKVLFVASRVRVNLAPEMINGRLRLSVRRISASGIPIPNWFHKGIAGDLAGMINETLDRNGLQLRDVRVEQGLIRVWAQVGAVPTTAPATP